MTDTGKFQILDVDQIDVAKIQFSPMKPNEKGNGKSCYMSYNGCKMFVRLPKMRCPFGISSFASDVPGEAPRYSLELSLGKERDHEEDPKLGVTYQFFTALDKRLCEEAKDNSKLWLNKVSPSIDVVEDNYNHMVKWSIDKATGEKLDYASRIRLNLKTDKDGNFRTNGIFDEERRRIESFGVNNVTEVISRGDYIHPIIEFGGVWASSMGFGVRLAMWQARVRKNLFRCHIDLTGPDSDDENSGPKRRKNSTDEDDSHDTWDGGDKNWKKTRLDECVTEADDAAC